MTARSHRDRGDKHALYRLKSEAFKKEKKKQRKKNFGFVQQISAFLIALNEYYDNLDAEKFNR